MPQPPPHVIPLPILPPNQRCRRVNLESIDPRAVALVALGGHQRWVHLEQDVVEAGPKVRAIDGGVTRRLWVIDVLALGAVELHGFDVGVVRLAHGKEGL